MKIMFFILLTGIMMAVAIPNAFAQKGGGILIEPYMGFADIAYDDEDGDKSDDWKGGGPGFGLKLGLSSGNLFVAGVYNLASVEAENQENSASKTDMDFEAMGLSLGYGGSFFHFWVNYWFSTKMEWSNFSWTNATLRTNWEAVYGNGPIEFTGDGWGFGIGIEPVDKIKLFAELHVYKYDKLKASGGLLGNTESDISGGDAANAFWLLGVSFPLKF